MVEVGSVLAHPVHGDLTVTKVGAEVYEEYIDEKVKFQKGVQVEAEFDRFIPGVRWAAVRPDGTKVSKLVFHSWYLCRLRPKE